jgi:hypothetical protein
MPGLGILYGGCYREGPLALGFRGEPPSGVIPVFPKKTECISYVCQDHNFHTYDRLMSAISQDIAQNVQKRFINFYYTHKGRLEGLYTNNDNYEDVTPSSSSTDI